jgi:hypothetical protein
MWSVGCIKTRLKSAYFVIAIGLSLEVLNACVYTRSRASSISLIPPLLIIGAMSTAFDWAMPVRIGVCVGAVVLNFGLPSLIRSLGLSHCLRHPIAQSGPRDIPPDGEVG